MKPSKQILVWIGHETFIFRQTGKYETATTIPSRQQGDLNNEHLFLPVLEAGRPEIRAPADSVLSERCRWPPSPCILTRW